MCTTLKHDDLIAKITDKIFRDRNRHGRYTHLKVNKNRTYSWLISTSEIRQPENRQPHCLAVRSSASHAHFLRSSGLLHPQYRFILLRSLFVSPVPLSIISHWVTLSTIVWRSTAFQQYPVCRPLWFQRWLLRTAIRVGAASLTFVILNYQLLSVNY